MMKKLICILTCVAMVLCFCTTALAADNETNYGSRTMEDILNEYHDKSFSTEVADEVSGAAYSVQGRTSGKTLEQETVDELVDAGYTAYNVTAENYDVLEDTLETDFTELGLDPNNSYIVIIDKGDESTASTYTSPDMDFDNDGHGGGFHHTYNGMTFTMRYITVTSASDSKLYDSGRYDLSSIGNYSDELLEIIDTVVVSCIDKLGEELIEKIPFGTIASLIGSALDDDGYLPLEMDELTLFGATAWTRVYTQIWNATEATWEYYHYSSYAVSRARCAGYRYSRVTNAPEWFEGTQISTTRYSDYYKNETQRKNLAAAAYMNCSTSSDKTGDIEFYFVSENGTINFGGSGNPLFIHEEITSFYLN